MSPLAPGAEWCLFAAAPFRERVQAGSSQAPEPRAALERCLAECGRGEARLGAVLGAPAWDLAEALEDEGEDAMLAAWEALQGALGRDGPPARLPGWAPRLWDPARHWLGLVEPGRAVKLVSRLDEAGLRERAGQLLGARGAGAARAWQRLLELLDRAAADDCCLLAAEPRP